MRASIQDVKKFLEENADKPDSETLSVARLGITDLSCSGFTMLFCTPQEEKPNKEEPKSEEPKKAVAKASAKK